MRRTREIINVVFEYRLKYEPGAREDAIEAAVQGGYHVGGAGPRGCYSAERIGIGRIVDCWQSIGAGDARKEDK